jgi:alpha-tubulin suppressor-like RCC1 family protein
MQRTNELDNLLIPTRLSPDTTNWVDAAFGPDDLVAIKSDGTLWAWGRFAAVYRGSAENPATPVRVGTNSDWQTCSSSEWARDLYLLLRKKDGSIWTMEFELSGGGPVRFTQIHLPTDVIAVAGGGGGGHGVAESMHDGVSTGVALTRDGQVWTWGRALGHSNPALQTLAGFARGLHFDVNWGDAKAINRDQPWQLPNLDPEATAKK